jgi:hypothetical protein
MVVLCRGRLELQQPAIRTKVRRKLKMLTKLHFRNGMTPSLHLHSGSASVQGSAANNIAEM